MAGNRQPLFCPACTREHYIRDTQLAPSLPLHHPPKAQAQRWSLTQKAFCHPPQNSQSSSLSHPFFHQQPQAPCPSLCIPRHLLATLLYVCFSLSHIKHSELISLRLCTQPGSAPSYRPGAPVHPTSTHPSSTPRKLNYNQEALLSFDPSALLRAVFDVTPVADAGYHQPAFGSHFPALQDFNAAFQPAASTSSTSQHSYLETRNASVHPSNAIATQLPTPPPPTATATTSAAASPAPSALASRTSSAGRKVPRSSQRPANSKPRYNPLHKTAIKNAAAATRLTAASKPASSSPSSLESAFETSDYSWMSKLEPYMLPDTEVSVCVDQAMNSFAVDPIMAPPLAGQHHISSPWAAFGASQRGLEEGRKWAKATAGKASVTECINPSETLTPEYLERQSLAAAEAAEDEKVCLPLEDLLVPEVIEPYHADQDDEEGEDEEMNYTPASKLWETHQYTGGPAKMHKSALQHVDDEEDCSAECATDKDAFEDEEEDEESEEDDDDEFDPDLDSDWDD